MNNKVVKLFCITCVLVGCENSVVPSEQPQLPEGAVVMQYGHPVDTDPTFSSAKNYVSRGEETPEVTRARLAEPIVFLALSGKLEEAGLKVDNQGNFVQAPWEVSYAGIQELLAAPPAELADMPTYMLDQMVVQIMLGLTDFLADDRPSERRVALAENFADILARNRYPQPELMASLLPIVRLSWSDDQVLEAARSALDAQTYFIESIEPMKETCGEQCYQNQVEGFSEKTRFARAEAKAYLNGLFVEK